MFDNTWMMVSVRRLTLQELMAIEALNGTMKKHNELGAILKQDKGIQVGNENNCQVISSQELNKLKQDDKPLNCDAAIQTKTELLNQNNCGINLGPSMPADSLTKSSIGNDDHNIKQENHAEEIKSDNKILIAIENEYLIPNGKSDVNSNETLSQHRWGKKQDVKLFKTLRQI